MSFIKITTIHPSGRETVGITQQTNVTAQEAFDNRLRRLNTRPQGFKADTTKLTIRLHPTETFDCEQLLEYAETIEAFDHHQPELPQEFLNLVERP